MVPLDNAVIVITGARGTGKSLLAATYAPPGEVGRVFYHDSERSANRAVQEMERLGVRMGFYGDLSAQFTDLPDDNDLLSRISRGNLPWVDQEQKGTLEKYYRYILEDLDRRLVRGQYDVYVHDTLEKLEAGMAAWSENHFKEFGFRSLGEARQYGKLWSEAIYPLYEQFLSAVFGRGVQTVILCSHLRTPWEGNRPVVGKVEPAGKKLLYRLASLMLWLVHDRGNADGAPAGLVLKERLGRLSVEDGQWKVRRMLPERIPHCTWTDIATYLTRGCNMANPEQGEAMTEAERQMISELLSDEQMRLMVLDAERELERAKQENGTGVVSGQVFSPSGVEGVVTSRAADSEYEEVLRAVRELSLNGNAGTIFPELLRRGHAPGLIQRAIGEAM